MLFLELFSISIRGRIQAFDWFLCRRSVAAAPYKGAVGCNGVDVLLKLGWFFFLWSLNQLLLSQVIRKRYIFVLNFWIF
jgi:hypothetical protein